MRLVRCLITRAHFATARCLRGSQNGRDRQAAARVINMHRSEAALVVMRVPERQLLAAVGGVEGVVDVEDIAVRRRHVCRELIDESARQFGRIHLARRIFEAADRRLRRQGRTSFRAATDGHLQGRIVTQVVVVDAILVAAADAEHAGRDNLGQAMPDAGRIAPIRQGRRQPCAHADLLLGGTQDQQASVR